MENQNNGVNPQEYYNPNTPQQPQYQPAAAPVGPAPTGPAPAPAPTAAPDFSQPAEGDDLPF